MSFQRYSMFTPDDLPAELPPQQGPSARAYGGAHREVTVDGVTTATVDAPLAYSAAQLNPFHGTESVLASARSKNGNPVSEVVGDTLVRINGIQAPASFWAAEGYLTKAADGTYAEVQGGPKEAPPEAPGEGFAPLSEQDMAGVNAAIEPVPQERLDGLAAKGISAAVGALDPSRVADYFGQVTGLNPQESQQRVAAATTAYQGQADGALSSRYGIDKADVQEFWAWAKAGHRDQLQDAVSKQIHNHDVSGYQALANRYLAETPPTLEAFTKAGIPVRGRGDQAEVLLGGRWLTPAAAARAGLA